MRAARRLVLASIFALAAEGAAYGQAVPGQEVARQAFRDGVALEKRDDFAGALAKFREAGEIKTTAGLRFHEAYCLERLGQLAAALDAYDAANKMAIDDGKKDVQKAVAARVGPLRPRVPELSVLLTSPPADAKVTLDGAEVAAPLLDGDAFHVDPGTHTLEASAAGFAPFSRTLSLPEGKSARVEITLRPAAKEPADASGGAALTVPTEPPAEAPRGRSVALPIATTVGAVALAAGGVVMYVLAGNAQDDANAACVALPDCDDRRGKIRTFDALALGGFIGAVGLGALSVVLWSSSGEPRTGAGPRRRLDATTSPRVQLHAAPGSLTVRGVF